MHFSVFSKNFPSRISPKNPPGAIFPNFSKVDSLNCHFYKNFHGVFLKSILIVIQICVKLIVSHSQVISKKDQIE